MSDGGNYAACSLLWQARSVPCVRSGVGRMVRVRGVPIGPSEFGEVFRLHKLDMEVGEQNGAAFALVVLRRQEFGPATLVP